ncbi:Translocation protein S62 [Savitreella phatthalungensis]
MADAAEAPAVPQHQQQQVDLRSEPYKQQAIAVGQFLRHLAALKNKSGVLDGKRAEYFKGKHALRALQSEAYAKAQRKNPQNLPKVDSLQSAGEVMRLLPIHLLALRVDLLEKEKVKRPATGSSAPAKSSRKLQINRQQEIAEDHHYVWLFEYIPLTTKLAGFGLLLLVLSVIMYPLWPPRMRVGVYYLSWGALGLVGLLFVIAVFRLILFVVTLFAVPPGIWLYPNLFEDVGFFDSFKPLWAWHEDKAAKKAAKQAKREAKLKKQQAKSDGALETASPGGAASATALPSTSVSHNTAGDAATTTARAAYIEDVDEDDD